MVQLPLRIAPGVVLGPDGCLHVAGPFVRGAAEQCRREAGRQKRGRAREAMTEAAAWIEEWTRMESGR